MKTNIVKKIIKKNNLQYFIAKRYEDQKLTCYSFMSVLKGK